MTRYLGKMGHKLHQMGQAEPCRRSNGRRRCDHIDDSASVQGFSHPSDTSDVVLTCCKVRQYMLNYRIREDILDE